LNPHTQETGALLRRLLERNLQLWFEGGVLRYKTPHGTLDQVTRDELAAHKASLRALMQEGHRYAPASSGQRRLWFIAQLAPGSPVYNLPALTFRITGDIDLDALAHALSALAARHEALRTVFPTLDGQPVQCVLPPHSVPLAVTDLTGHAHAMRESEAMRQATAMVRAPFSLAEGPLLRASVWCLRRPGSAGEAGEHLFVVAMHHIITDGWSITQLARELWACYEAYVAGQPMPFHGTPLTYADFTLWQRLQDARGAWETARAYWRDQLRGAPIAAFTPVRTPPPNPTGEGQEFAFELSPALRHGLEKLGNNRGASLFMVLLAGFKTLIYRHTGVSDVVAGSGTANRMRPEFANTAGLFVNTLALRTHLGGNPTFAEVLDRVKATTLDAYDHQEFPFEHVVETVRPGRGDGETPFFRNAMVLQNLSASPGFQGSPAVTRMAIDPGVAQFDMLLSLEETDDALQGRLQYDTGRFDADFAQGFAAQFRELLTAAVNGPTQRIDDLPLMTPEDARRIVARGRGEEAPPPVAGTLHELFAAQAGRTPEALAVVTPGESVSYRELDAMAARVAGVLAARGVGLEDMVGVAVERGIPQVAAVLGILRAGGAFLPLDPGFPAARIEYMLRAAGVSRVVADGASALQLAPFGLDVVPVEDALAGRLPAKEPAVSVAAHHLAYVIFTSGSTGRPKGVLLEHGGAATFAGWLRRYFALGPGKRMLQFAPMSYDAYVMEWLGALTSGAALCSAPADTVLPGSALLRTLGELGVTHVLLPPSALAMLQNPDDMPGCVEHIIVGGEACTADLIERWGKRVKLYNAYGPTETTVCASACDAVSAGRPRCIGRPVDHARLYVLDAAGRLVPEGMPGELCIAGAGVARGYLGGEDAPAFEVRQIAGHEERIYHSGDLVRMLPDGQLEFLGRMDAQVKINGHRIEPGEIAAVLREHPGVREAAVVPRTWGRNDTRLVAFYVPAGASTLDSGVLRAHCKGQLPPYMTPAHFQALDALPRTPGGKLDTVALERCPVDDPAPPRTAPPATPTEETVAALYAALLGRAKVGRGDDFFALGGHSLLAARLVARIHEVCGVQLRLRSLFGDASVATVASAIDAALAEAAAAAQDVDQMTEEEIDDELARLLGNAGGDNS
jgi:amino acid adenylation domain-containing protein